MPLRQVLKQPCRSLPLTSDGESVRPKRGTTLGPHNLFITKKLPCAAMESVYNLFTFHRQIGEREEVFARKDSIPRSLLLPDSRNINGKSTKISIDWIKSAYVVEEPTATETSTLNQINPVITNRLLHVDVVASRRCTIPYIFFFRSSDPRQMRHTMVSALGYIPMVINTNMQEISLGVILLNGFSGTLEVGPELQLRNGTFLISFHNFSIRVNEKAYTSKEIPTYKALPSILLNLGIHYWDHNSDHNPSL
uniref:Uncharacterized protein n=1 Tax=Glossina austeni TaxID=7395 RepID=A0A1A9VLV5_GLOAU